jgi:hypothetical protein
VIIVPDVPAVQRGIIHQEKENKDQCAAKDQDGLPAGARLGRRVFFRQLCAHGIEMETERGVNPLVFKPERSGTKAITMATG